MKQHIYGLTGFAGVGKDTVADLLAEHLGFRKLAFADALRAEVADAFQTDALYLTHPSTKNQPAGAFAMRNAPLNFRNAVIVSLLKEHACGEVDEAWLNAPRSPRQILQWWGTEYRRTQDPRYWTRRLLERVVYHQRDGEVRIVISDVRFPNEAETVLVMGGALWQITRPSVDANTTPEGQHASATSGEQFKPSAVIANCHDIGHLQQLVLTEFFARESGIPSAKVTVTE
ncbi:MAG: hypothetical protein EOO27_13830 [Comamonadaceae bacterium]|nr:MAG: hypothetical protein EOO27_13830 [Comamonadaceae bacterium]